MAGIKAEPRGSRYGRWYWPLRECFDLHNLFEEHQPQWPADQAVVELEGLWPTHEGRHVVLLGKRLNKAYRVISSASNHFYQWHEYRGCMVATIPHPSQLNLMYNNEQHVVAASRVLKKALG